jgi:site-specific recombinase XerD
MLSEIEQFQKWLRRRALHSSTPIHYASDLALFFTHTAKPIKQITMSDVDQFIEESQRKGHATATINR